MESELVIIEEKKALELFSTEGGLDFILDEVKAKVDGFKHDLSTDKGRKETASLAHKVSKFKVRLDGMGKGLVTEWKESARKVDASRKHIRDTLETLRDEARKPLTEWENEDKERIARHEEALENLRLLVENEEETSGVYAENLKKAKAVEMGPCWEEFAGEAAEVKDEVVTYLEGALEKALKSEAEAAELERLRKENEDRMQRDRDATIAKMAADDARKEEAEKARKIAVKVEEDKQAGIRREAEAKAQVVEAERARIAAEEAAKERAKQVERDSIAAEERAKVEQEMAIRCAKEEEAARIKAEADRKAEEDRKREANKRHVGKIRKEVTAGFVEAGFSDEEARDIVLALVSGNIPHVSIQY